MFRSRSPATLAVLGMLGVLLSSSAHADDFFFSFSNVTGNVPGTVSGEVFGLTNNATSAATNVVVNSFPAGLTGLPAAPFNVPDYAASLGQVITNNSFIVTDHVITLAEYTIAGEFFSMNGAFNALFDPTATNSVQNLGGIGEGGVTFTLAAAPNPIPGAGLLSYLALGLLGLGSLGWKKVRPRTSVDRGAKGPLGND
jgi:hypothetical protein